MIERLKSILDYYNLTASSFADRIDVPRSSISHLLSGRNKPSLDFIIKVEKAFEEVELDWLVYGKGNFPNTIKENFTNVEEATTSPSLFSNPSPDDISKKNENISIQEQQRILDKKIKNIVVLYEDGTFEDYKKR
ncbi:helix-turn-helix transcriptional regulator [Tenacibaculum aiptasiae]|uniref:Helix-turn-helix transcriptional regulator n=1 Tax=Tenacibaculum aiptasiae TaxID=426481 RepID=A0A7J5AP50_9FLAO|nr:helix-turn-helix transcriptional regulator [Tenacibaculum aiptasiae]KAB1159360.1 helix-turn-helix transcriptional regulator [Tenacibaculum aiptasiae]